MRNNPLVNAGAALIYISLIASFLFYGTQYLGPTESPIIPIAMLSLFVLSAAVMGYLFLGQPLALYLDGEKAEAVSLFLKTVGIFAVLTVLVLVALVLKVGIVAP